MAPACFSGSCRCTTLQRASIKGPISVPLSPSNAVKCYPCREVPLNYNRSLLFHGGDTGSTPVRDAKISSLRNRMLLTLFGGSSLLAALIEVRNDEQDRSQHDE